MSKIYLTEKSPKPLADYSQALEVDRHLYISGQLPFYLNTTEPINDDIKTQAKYVFKNITHILNDAGYAVENLIKVELYLTELENLDEVNKAFNEEFQNCKAVRTCIGVSSLPKDCKIEVAATAYK
ncbi:RidA family protein [Clostridium oceanicum]|uniref:RidA family protein n=1 Tax=Clostridium oceanicum TaxID=1543 RepID=A0ABP3UJ51_9CLOT